MTRNPDDVLLSGLSISFFAIRIPKGPETSRGGVQHTRLVLSVYKYESHSFPRQKRSLPPFDWGAGEREGGRARNEIHTDTSAFSLPDKGEPGENIYYVLHVCIFACSICTSVSKGG